MNPNERDLALRMEEAERDLVQAAGEIMERHSLPCFLLEPIMDKVHRQLIESKNQEIKAARLREALANQTANTEEE